MKHTARSGGAAERAEAGTLLRRWTTSITAGRAGDYERFAGKTSLPMFEGAPLCLAVCMSGAGAERCVTTVWRDAGHLEAFERSQRYIDTVDQISSAGFLSRQQAVTLEPLQLLWFQSPAC